MKTFACVFLVCLVAGLSNGLDLSGKLASFHAKNQATLASLKEKTEHAAHQLTEGVKQIEENMNEFFKKIADTQNVCKRNGSAMLCCAKDLLKNDLCLGLNMDTANFTVEVTFSVNGRKFIDDKISGQNPPPICGALPPLPILKLCVQPYGLGYSNDTFHFCASLNARVFKKDIARVNLNCMQIKDGNLTPVKPTTNVTGSAIINIDTAKMNPLLNKSFNPVKQLTGLFNKNKE